MTQPFCPYLGVIPADGTYVTVFFRQNTMVGPGRHTVQTFLYTDSGALIFMIPDIQYQLYQAVDEFGPG